MNARACFIALFIILCGLFIWRVEWDTSFMPVRFNAAMTNRHGMQQAPPPGAVPYGSAASGHTVHLLYRQRCAACHGEQGTPPPYLASYPGMPHITNLRATAPATTWADSIARGRGAMPAYGNTLAPEQIQALIQHIPTLGQAPPPTPVHRRVLRRQVLPHPSAPAPTAHFIRDWWIPMVTFLLSIPLGYAFVAILLPLCGTTNQTRNFTTQLLLTITTAGLGMGIGTVLWGAAGFAMLAFAFAAGVALHLLRSKGQMPSYMPAILTLALSLSAYALAMPLLVGSYLPGKDAAASYLVAHGCCIAGMLVLALLPHYLLLRTIQARICYTLVVLLMLAWSHGLLAALV